MVCTIMCRFFAPNYSLPQRVGLLREPAQKLKRSAEKTNAYLNFWGYGLKRTSPYAAIAKDKNNVEIDVLGLALNENRLEAGHV